MTASQNAVRRRLGAVRVASSLPALDLALGVGVLRDRVLDPVADRAALAASVLIRAGQLDGFGPGVESVPCIGPSISPADRIEDRPVLELLEKILPLMLAAASNPAVVAIVVLSLTSADRPLVRAGAFVAGFAAVLVALGDRRADLLHEARARPSAPAAPCSPGSTWCSASACSCSPWSPTLRRGQAASQSRLLERVSPRAYFAVGAIFMITNASALVAYGPLLREIAIADVSRFERGARARARRPGDRAADRGPGADLPARAAKRRSGSWRRSAAASTATARSSSMVVFGAIGTYMLIRGITRL